MSSRKLGWLERRRIARAVNHFHALDVERIQISQGESPTRYKSNRRPVLVHRALLIPVAVAILLILGFGIEYLVSNHFAVAHQLWRQVPDGWETAELWSKGGPLGFEDPIALYLKEESGELLIADSYKNAVFRINSNGDLSMLVTKTELEYTLGFALRRGADGPVSLAMEGDVLYVGISTYEGQGTSALGRGGAVLYVTCSGAMGVLSDRAGNPVRVALHAERESHHGMVVRNGALYVTGDDGTIRIIQLDENLTQAQHIDVIRYRFGCPTALVFDDQGYLYVADEERACVIRFLPDGRLDESFRIDGLEHPTSLAFGKDSALFVAESGAGGRIRWYSRVGEQLLLQGEFNRFSEEAGLEPFYLYGFQGPSIAANATSGALFIVDNTGELDTEGKAPAVYRCVPLR